MQGPSNLAARLMGPTVVQCNKHDPGEHGMYLSCDSMASLFHASQQALELYACCHMDFKSRVLYKKSYGHTMSA